MGFIARVTKRVEAGTRAAKPGKIPRLSLAPQSKTCLSRKPVSACLTIVCLVFGFGVEGMPIFAQESPSKELLLRANQLILEKSCDEAKEILEQVVGLEDAKVRVQRNLGVCYLERNDWSEAEVALNTFLEKFPEDASTTYLKGYLLFSAGRYGESLSLMTRYVAMEPGDAQGHKILGLSHFVLGRTDRAEPELRRAIELDPRDPEAHYHLGRLFYNRNDFAAALEAFDQVIELDSNSVRTFNHLGQTKQALGEFAGARDAYLKAIQLEQQQSARSEWPYYNLGLLYITEGRAEEAVQYLQQALERRPSWPEARVKLARAFLSSDRLEAALRQLNKVVEADPENADAHYQLGRAWTKKGRPDQARRHFALFEKLRQP